MGVAIPEPVAIRPAALLYAKGAVPAEKSFTIQVENHGHTTATEAT